jgi:hypothetical protein
MNNATTLADQTDAANSRSLNGVVKCVERTLNMLSEVKWDRWSGDLGSEMGIAVYGWIPRSDGRSDFVFLRFDNDGPYMFATSSAQYSAEYSRRLGFDGSSGHQACKRIEDHFTNVKSVAKRKST